jgi:hypothetical protein
MRLDNESPEAIFLLPSVRREHQLLLFQAALDDVTDPSNLPNQAMTFAIFRGRKNQQLKRYSLL